MSGRQLSKSIYATSAGPKVAAVATAAVSPMEVTQEPQKDEMQVSQRAGAQWTSEPVEGARLRRAYVVSM